MNSCLEVYQLSTEQKKRLGISGDGGYVIADLGAIYDCYISAGVSTEESFTRDFIAYCNKNEKKINITNSFAFDGTIETYPYQYTNEIQFIKKNIDSFNDDKHTNLLDVIENFHRIFLKMDIEGGEYPWLLTMSEENLNKFQQISIEIHGLNDDSFDCKKEDKIKCLEKLKKTHYLVHAHGNNFSPVTDGIPDVLELTYIHKANFKGTPQLNQTPFPIFGLDFPNWHSKKEIILDYCPFCINENKENKIGMNISFDVKSILTLLPNESSEITLPPFSYGYSKYKFHLTLEKIE